MSRTCEICKKKIEGTTVVDRTYEEPMFYHKDCIMNYLKGDKKNE